MNTDLAQNTLPGALSHFANRASAKTLNRATGAMLVVLGVSMLAVNALS